MKREEQQFEKTLERGLAILNDEIKQLSGNTLNGEVVFKLYDTYGFPMDLTADIARENELVIDEEGFNAAMQAQRERAQKASQFGDDYNAQVKATTKSVYRIDLWKHLRKSNIYLEIQ